MLLVSAWSAWSVRTSLGVGSMAECGLPAPALDHCVVFLAIWRRIWDGREAGHFVRALVVSSGLHRPRCKLWPYVVPRHITVWIAFRIPDLTFIE